MARKHPKHAYVLRIVPTGQTGLATVNHKPDVRRYVREAAAVGQFDGLQRWNERNGNRVYRSLTLETVGGTVLRHTSW